MSTSDTPQQSHTAMKLWRLLNIGLKSIKHLDMSEITSICFYSSGDWLFLVSIYSVSSCVASNVSLKLYIPFVFLPDEVPCANPGKWTNILQQSCDDDNI